MRHNAIPPEDEVQDQITLAARSKAIKKPRSKSDKSDFVDGAFLKVSSGVFEFSFVVQVLQVPLSTGLILKGDNC